MADTAWAPGASRSSPAARAPTAAARTWSAIPTAASASSARPRRIAVHGTHARLANADVEIVNLSRTGVLVKVSQPLRTGTDWPLVLDLSDTSLQVTGRVVRCRPGSDPQDTTIGPPHHDLALAFVTKSSEADAALYAVCGSQSAYPLFDR